MSQFLCANEYVTLFVVKHHASLTDTEASAKHMVALAAVADQSSRYMLTFSAAVTNTLVDTQQVPVSENKFGQMLLVHHSAMLVQAARASGKHHGPAWIAKD